MKETGNWEKYISMYFKRKKAGQSFDREAEAKKYHLFGEEKKSADEAIKYFESFQIPKKSPFEIKKEVGEIIGELEKLPYFVPYKESSPVIKAIEKEETEKERIFEIKNMTQPGRLIFGKQQIELKFSTLFYKTTEEIEAFAGAPPKTSENYEKMSIEINKGCLEAGLPAYLKLHIKKK